MATVAAVNDRVEHVGNRKLCHGTLTLTGSYTAGGELIPGSVFGLELELNEVELGPAICSAGIFATSWDKTNGKAKLYGAVDASPAANEQGPELAAGAIPGGPAAIRYQARGLGSAAA